MQTLQLKIACLLFRLSILFHSMAISCTQASRKIAAGAIPEKAREGSNDATNRGGESV